MRPSDKAIGFRILVEPEQVASQSESGLVLGTDDMIEQQQRGIDVGTVLDIGSAAFKLERFGNECPIKVGDKIRFKQYTGHIFRLKNELGKPISGFYQVINDDDVLSVLEESEDV